ncbi:MAG: hypothetical protein JRJ66_09070 [Deltaproteobacteria bacterium]|nr:hypothetical protein [Deltaproteobacteria bacterium]MBW2082675.1 hypothetical protein [Deltaproteobacteria bacterium]
MKKLFLTHNAAFCLFLFFASFYFLTNAGGYKEGDESVMSALARQIAYHGKIGFEKTQYPPEEDPCTKGTDGLYHPKWGLGQSLVQVPFYFAHRLLWTIIPYDREDPRDSTASRFSEMLLVFSCPSGISALGCLLLFFLGLRLGFSRRASLLLTFVYALGTMVWPYSKSLMSGATLNTAILGGVYGVISYRFDHKRKWLLLSSACMGFALITKVVSFGLLVPLLAYLFFSPNRRKRVGTILVCFVLPYALFAAFQLWYNMLRYGDLFTFGYDRQWDALGFSTPFYVGLWGLFLSPGKSFFLYTPAAILGLVCLRPFLKEKKAECLLFLGVAGFFTIPHSLWVQWAGDWAWGPRFLVPVVPYFILPIGYCFKNWYGLTRPQRGFAVALVAVSLFVQILGVAIHPFSFIEIRWDIVSRFLKESPKYSYADTYGENAFVNFSPMFSHIVGNWWLFKHMILDYDLRKDAPWKTLGDFEVDSPKWVKGNRTIPFWWPISFSMASPRVEKWVIGLALANAMTVLLVGLRLRRELSPSGSGIEGDEKEGTE